MPEWKKVRYLKTPLSATDDEANWEMQIILPEPLASWDVFSYWERERYFSMKKHLTPQDTLFDVGAEHGWLSVVYGHLVMPEHMVLIEPTKEFWPNIKATWQKNFLSYDPLDCVVGLVGEKTGRGVINRGVWPPEALGELTGANKYQYLHDNTEDVGVISLDDYCLLSGNYPTAITIDVEGGELQVLKGSERTLKSDKPKLWVSIHPDLALRDYGTQEGEVKSYLEGLGYKGQLLAVDHEQHWLFL